MTVIAKWIPYRSLQEGDGGAGAAKEAPTTTEGVIHRGTTGAFFTRPGALRQGRPSIPAGLHSEWTSELRWLYPYFSPYGESLLGICHANRRFSDFLDLPHHTT